MKWLSLVVLAMLSTGCGPAVPEFVTVQFLRATTTGGSDPLPGVKIRAYPDPRADDEVCYLDEAEADGTWAQSTCTLTTTWEAVSISAHDADERLLDAWVWDPPETLWELALDSGEEVFVVGDESALTFTVERVLLE